MKRPTIKAFVFGDKEIHIYRKRWYLANVKLDMFISILYVNIANLKSVPIEIFAEILNVFMIVRNIRQNSDVFYIFNFTDSGINIGFQYLRAKA